MRLLCILRTKRGAVLLFSFLVCRFLCSTPSGLHVEVRSGASQWVTQDMRTLVLGGYLDDGSRCSLLEIVVVFL